MMMIPFKYNIHCVGINDVDVHQDQSYYSDSIPKECWSIFLPIPGIVHPLKIRFPSGKLPVCRKCKAQYKTRKYCRDHPRNHDSMPWSPTFISLTFDNSCFVFEGQGDLQLKSGIFTTKIIEESEALHTKYKIKKHSFSLLNKKEENCAIATATSTKQEQPLPMCFSCKQKRYTGAYCRGKPHQFLPWSTLYFQVSCEVSSNTSLDNDKAQQNIPTIFDCVDRRSRTLFIQVYSDTDECKAEWVEENDEETEKRPLNVSNRKRSRTTNNNGEVQITNTDNHLDLITREEECQKKTKHQHNVSALSYHHTMPQLPHVYTHESQTMQFPPYPNSVYWNQQPHFYPYSTINTTYPYENHNYRVPETSYQSEAHHISNFQPQYPPQPSVQPHVSFQPSAPPHAFSPIRTSKTNTRCYFDNTFSHSVIEEKDKNHEQNKDNGKEETDSFGFFEHGLEE